MSHARLSGSKAKRWINCPGSVTAPVPEGYDPDSSGDTEWAREGTAAHELAERCLKHRSNPNVFVGTKLNNVVVTQDMADAVMIYLGLTGPIKDSALDYGIEQRISLDGIKPPEDMFGTPDFFAVVMSEDEDDEYVHEVLVIADLKYGQVHVPADDWQFRYYAVGLLTGRYKNRPIKYVDVFVCQPRAPGENGPVSSIRYTVEEVERFARQILGAAFAVRAENPPLIPGDWCRYCPAAPLCPAKHEETLETAKEAFADKELPAPDKLSPEQIGRVLKKAAQIEAWFATLRAHAESEMLKGNEIPGVKLVEKRAQRRWLNPELVIDALSRDYAQEDIFEPRKLKSPAQIEKLIGVKSKKILAPLTVKHKGVTIALQDDRRPAVNPSTDIFMETDEND